MWPICDRLIVQDMDSHPVTYVNMNALFLKFKWFYY